jgi:hypothetical protein
MSRGRCGSRLLIFFLCLLSLAARPVTAQPDSVLVPMQIDTAFGELGAKLTVFLAGSYNSTHSWYDDPDLRLNFMAYTVSSGARLHNVLRSNGIQPDGNAYTLVYALNPELQDVDRLAVGQVLLLPTLEGPSIAEAVYGRRHLVRLGIFGPLRKSIVQRADQLVGWLDQIIDNDGSTFPPEVRAAALAATERLWRLLDGLDFERAVAGEQMLEMIDFELSVAEELLAGTTPTSALDRSSTDLLLALETSVSELASCARTAVNCEVGVHVRTLGHDGAERMGVQVYAAPFALASSSRCATDPRCRRAFRRVSSPAEHELAAGAHFLIWAERNGRIISESKDLRPRRDSENEMDLNLDEP